MSATDDEDKGQAEVPTHVTIPGFPAMGRDPVPPPDLYEEDAVLSSELEEVWAFLSIEERVEGFRILSRSDAEDLYDRLSATWQR